MSHVCCWQLSSVMSHFVRISPKQMKIMIVQHKNNCVKDDHQLHLLSFLVHHCLIEEGECCLILSHHHVERE